MGVINPETRVPTDVPHPILAWVAVIAVLPVVATGLHRPRVTQPVEDSRPTTARTDRSQSTGGRVD